MSERLLVDEARRRASVHRELGRYLERIAVIVKRIDVDAEAYLLGSVVEGRSLLSSDIDILVVTDKPPGEVLAEFWRHGIRDPFEIHVITRDQLPLYRRRGSLVKIT